MASSDPPSVFPAQTTVRSAVRWGEGSLSHNQKGKKTKKKKEEEKREILRHRTRRRTVGLAQEYALVDPELAMLRVDQRDPTTGTFSAAGAFRSSRCTARATHHRTTARPDIQGLVERRLERHIDRDLNRASDSASCHVLCILFANGAEGDVSRPGRRRAAATSRDSPRWAALEGPFTRTLWEWRETTASTWAPAGTRRERRSP